jgi:hypothetical protein
MASLLLLCVSVPAQVSHVPGTGCGATITYVGGVPQIGLPISIANSYPCYFTSALLAIGFSGAAIPWPGCNTPICTIGVIPVELTFGGIRIWQTLWIPNDPNLRGLCFYAQTGCLTPATACMHLDQTAKICIQ